MAEYLMQMPRSSVLVIVLLAFYHGWFEAFGKTHSFLCTKPDRMLGVLGVG